MPPKVLVKFSLSLRIVSFYLNYRSSRPELFLGRGILKMCSKFIGEHLWWTAAFGTSFLAYLMLSLTLLKKLMKKLKRPYLVG